ncbi:MAG: hypothetical protein WA431_13365 [Candidatus Cybelea sp.]
MSDSKSKIDAIYELRHAAEQKALAEKAVDDDPSWDNRDNLLDKQTKLNSKTVAAIRVCHQCGHEHLPDAPHAN